MVVTAGACERKIVKDMATPIPAPKRRQTDVNTAKLRRDRPTALTPSEDFTRQPH
jgi:hypothetical protein